MNNSNESKKKCSTIIKEWTEGLSMHGVPNIMRHPNSAHNVDFTNSAFKRNVFLHHNFKCNQLFEL